jgi:glycosyltransferase involved in cell wall biosynthesis
VKPMSAPKFSVIIPTYNCADTLGEAIKSVLNQKFHDFEIVVINDASTDHTTEVVNGFDDDRIKTVIHGKNRGSSASRNTGVQISTGEYIALLDADDVFHPDKLLAHMELLDNHPQVGVTYNSHFDITQSIENIRGIWQAPSRVDLKDFVLGYPFAPSDSVLRREWLFRIGLFDENNTFYGDDLNINCRLALAGCQFASVDRVLNYRRHQPGRKRKDLDLGLRNVLQNLDQIFNDSRCPIDVCNLRDLAYANNYLDWAYLTLAQRETKLGQQYLREAIRLNPNILTGEPCELVEYMIANVINDDQGNLADYLKRIFVQLPIELTQISERYQWALARGYMIKGIRDIIWGRSLEGSANITLASELGASLDNNILQSLTSQLIIYNKEFGTSQTETVIRNITPYLIILGNQSTIRQLMGSYWVNQGYINFHAGNYKEVSEMMLRAIGYDPTYLMNRGVISATLHSLFNKKFSCYHFPSD